MCPEPHAPHHNIVWQLINKFMETAPLADAPRSGRPTVLTQNKILDTCDHIMKSPKKSVCKLSQQVAVKRLNKENT